MRRIVALPLVLVSFALAACSDHPPAYGDANSIIAAMPPDLWEVVREDVYAALEPTILTVRDEKTFTVTYQDPGEEHWGNLRRFKQILVAGTADQPYVAQALAEARDSVTGPGMYRAYDVWARGQQIVVILLSRPEAADEVRAHLSDINAFLDEQYRNFARNRMFLSGVDSALSDTLFAQGRFRVLLPKVYTWERKADSVYVFRNDQPDPAELIRQVAVTWRSPIPPDLQPEDLLAWRDSLTRFYNEPQLTDLSRVEAGPFEYRGRPAYRIQAVWQNPPELNWPAGGPFILRAVVCPQQARMYLLDAWLYAPQKEKYEYMIQLQTILDSFRCAPS